MFTYSTLSLLEVFHSISLKLLALGVRLNVVLRSCNGDVFFGPHACLDEAENCTDGLLALGQAVPASQSHLCHSLKEKTADNSDND